MKIRKILFLFCLAYTVFFTFSCSHKLGYSVVLWSSPQDRLYAGDLVQVYIKSNISHVYVIGFPGSKEKIEVPFWQISEPQSKTEALKTYEPYKSYKSIYAHVATDGLPMRLEPVNTSRQVYRLRKNETIKILCKGEGVAPSSGSTPLEGDWYWVMACDGTTGWCFSYNLKLYDENAPVQAESEEEEFDEVLEKVLASKWYPESYQTMIANSRVDLKAFKSGYHFDTGRDSGQIEICIDDLARSWPYKGATKIENGSYRLKDTPLVINVRRDDYIMVQYNDDKGMPHSYGFVTLDSEISEIIETEEGRRTALYERLINFSSSYNSSNYGELYLFEGNTFLWKGYQRLVPSVIPSNSGERGTISFTMFLDSSLAASYESNAKRAATYDGVITFTFAENKKSVSFMYKLESNGLRLEEISHALVKNSVVLEKGTNALVLFFGIE